MIGCRYSDRMDDTRKHQLRQRAHQRAATYEGQAGRISDALGILEFSFLYGYDATRICHGFGRVRDAETLLGFKLLEEVPRRTDLSSRVRGIRLVDSGRALWQVVRRRVEGKDLVSSTAQGELPL